MKIIISDYDNTYNLHKKNKLFNLINLKNTNKLIKKFIDNGNIFIINTGRYYNSIYNDIIKYNIPFNYLICNNGGEIYDNNFKNYKTTPLPNKIINILKDNNYTLYYDKSNKIVVGAVKYNYDNTDLEKLYSYKDIIRYVYRNNKLRIFPKVSKLDNINLILNKYNDYIIYAFGDSDEDYEMLSKYTGYTTNKNIKIDNVKYINNISNIIKKLIKNTQD